MSVNPKRLGITVIGCGRWGPNHLRAFNQLPGAQVVRVVDSDPSRFGNLPSVYPHVEFSSRVEDAFDDDRSEAVVIATPAASHAELIRPALAAGKHVLVEKPICTRSVEARALAELAERKQRVLMVGHVFLFHDVFKRIQVYVADREIGRLQYVHAIRTNLGPIRGDVNAVYDLASHD
ncbi:MAG: Gfo/Idh/MocA family oxidoreductase, partial [Phycisphaerae bacterium]